MHRFLNSAKQRITDWCLNVTSVEVGQLHRQLQPVAVSIPDPSGIEKFIEQTTPTDLFVKTPTGYQPVKHTHKTVKYDVWEITTPTGTLKCADDHIVILDDNREVPCKNLVANVDRVQTVNGPQLVTDVKRLDQPAENMYDLTLNDANHVYYTDGILSHNSWICGAFLLWYAMFNDEKFVLIASNKNANAMEMIHRVRFMYENVPTWLKRGLTEDGWNKHAVGFDNGSRIVSQATTVDTGRGFAVSLLFLDEFAFVRDAIQQEFWTSISPTLSTGGSCIICSTPNGDTNIFSELWRGAELETNGFVPIEVRWDEPPGRDAAFRDAEVARIGLTRWNQEYACQFLSSDPLLIDTMVLATLTKEMRDVQPISVQGDLKFYRELIPGSTYLLGVDPATGTGSDFTVFVVYEFPSLEQVCEYRSNTSSSAMAYHHLKRLIKTLEKMEGHVYFSVECNGVGEGILALYEADETPPENADLISETGMKRQGMTTTGKSKMKSCVAFKDMIERRIIRIRSPQLLKEMKHYVRSGAAFAAKRSATDDIISATLIVIRLLEEIATFDNEAYEKLYSASYFQEDEYQSEETFTEADMPLEMSFG